MVKRILNTTTGKYYQLRQKTTSNGTAGQIMGLWSPKRTVKKMTSKRYNVDSDVEAFAGACYNDNSIIELLRDYPWKIVDETDCEGWNLTNDEWREGLKLAIKFMFEGKCRGGKEYLEYLIKELKKYGIDITGTKLYESNYFNLSKKAINQINKIIDPFELEN